MRITTRLAVTIGGLIFVVGMLTILFVNSRMKAHALHEAQNAAGIILDSRLSVHTYFSHQLKPILFDAAPQLHESFEPAWMSSTYAVREMEKYFKLFHTTPQYYKEAAINARHPENEADAFEREFIELLNQDVDLQSTSAIRTFEDTPYLTILQRGETMEATCLQCHSKPELAPPGLVDAYGPHRSFGRTEGEVVSAVSIRIPLDEAYASANRLSSQLALAFGAVLLGIYGMIVLLNKFWIFNPLSIIRNRAQGIAFDPKQLGETIKRPQGSELAELVDSFNSMSAQLFKERHELEDRVRKRTADLEESNNQLSREMSHRKKAEERLLQTNQQLQATNAEKDRLFSIIAHDLKSPVSGLVSSTAILADQPDVFSEQETRTLSKALHKNARNTMALLEDLLQWSRMCQNGIDYTPTLNNLHELVSISLSSAQDAARHKDIAIRTAIPRDLFVLADQPMINTVVRNILFNAIKFTPRGGEVVVTARQTAQTILIQIQDNGIGIPEQALPTLFTVDQGKRQLGTEGEKGTGLGLVLCNQFIAQHGGEIWVDSTPGQGTTVNFTLPVGK